MFNLNTINFSQNGLKSDHTIHFCWILAVFETPKNTFKYLCYVFKNDPPMTFIMYFYGILHFIYKVIMDVVQLKTLIHHFSLSIFFSNDYNEIELPLPQAIFWTISVEVQCN